MNKRLITAFCCYAALAALAAFTLDGGMLRNGVWVLMAGLAAKTFAGYKAEALRNREDAHAPDDAEDPSGPHLR